MKVGQTVYLADIIETDANGENDRILVREYEVKMLGKRFYDLVGPKHRLRQTWEGSMGTILLLGSTPEEAVRNREKLLDNRLKQARESLKRHEEDVFEKRKAFHKWYAERGL